MNEYITEQNVTDNLGAGWEGTGDATRAVLESNAWMTARGVFFDPDESVPADVITAGSYLAQMAAQGSLYNDRAPDLKRKRVKADTVESEQEYQDGASASNGTLRLVLDLLRPHLPTGGGSVFNVSRG